MPPKQKQAKAQSKQAKPQGKQGRNIPGKPTKGKKKGEDADDEDALVAIVLADSFNSRMLPLTAQRPRALCPILGVPLLDWTLESLALADVEHVYILVRSFPDQIRDHLAQRQDQRSITVLPIPTAMSVGDAMRELDNAKIIKNDFLLVHADGVGNLDLEEIVRIHKERRKVDKDAIMTLCTMPASGDSNRRPTGDTSVMVTNPNTGVLVHYEPVPAVPRKKHIVLPASIFDSKEGTPDVEVRNDLVDCGVDVCSVDVPPLFTENFDYQELRRDFVPGILTSEILTAKIFLHVATSSPLGSAAPSGVRETSLQPWDVRIGRGWGYAMRVRDTKSYDVVAKDILGKWVTPLGPGGYLPTLNVDAKVAYTAYPSGRYQAPGVFLSLSSKIGRATMLGCRTRVGKHTFIDRSVLGDDNVIGDHTRITHSYLWSHVIVGDHVELERAILGDNVRLGNNVSLGRGCVVADGCVIGDGVSLPAFTRVGSVSHADYLSQRSGHSLSSTKSKAVSGEGLGHGGKGFIWSAPNGCSSDDSDEEEDEDPIEAWNNVSLLQIGRDTEVGWSDSEDDVSAMDGDSELASSEDEEEMDNDSDARSRTTDAPSQGEGESGQAAVLTVNEGQATAAETQAELAKINDFYQEAFASLQRADSEGHFKENANIELSTLRMASNVEQHELVAVVFVWLLQQSRPDLREVATLLGRWGGLLAQVARGEEAVAISVIQSFCAARSEYGSLFGSLLMGCYNISLPSDGKEEQGVFTEDGLISWYKSRASNTPNESVERLLALPQRLKGQGDETKSISTEEVSKLRAQGREVIESILAESDEDSDEDSSEEEADESDD